MKKIITTASWLHKPGSSTILKYKYTPSTSRNWTNEMEGLGGYWPPTITYTGTIYYVYY